jgi:hypothetical protein
MKKIIPFLILLLAVTSCKKDNPSSPVNEDQITISTQFYGTNVYYVYGYSFELGKQVSSMDTRQVADVIPTRVQKPDGTVLGAQLTAGGNNPYGFSKVGEFSTLAEASGFYDAYNSVEVSSWQSLSDTLAPFQVYAFKTYNENYVKLMITSVDIVGASNPTENFVEIGLKYMIQRDGTSMFTR